MILKKYTPFLILIGLIIFFVLYKLLSKFTYNPFNTNIVSNRFDSSNYKVNKNEITWIIHMYPPEHNAGAEWMAHCMNLYLIKQGWTVNVILPPSFKLRKFQGVNFYTMNNTKECEEVIGRSKLLVSHLDFEPRTVEIAELANKPVVIVIHNWSRKYLLKKYKENSNSRNIYLIHNSLWIKNLYNYIGFNSIIVNPPVSYKEYEVLDRERKYVTLINLNDNKGGNVLIQIAKKMPDVQFMGVGGGYDTQIRDEKLKNITYVNNTPEIKEIYKETDILLVPSRQESWGRVAIEAISSGIPVIANPTPGLREALDYCGIYISRDEIDEYVKMIRKLKTDENYYKKVSTLSVKRSRELDPEPQLKLLDQWLSKIEYI
jgi:glycosyltransferase involved in cell wall biosynthesis